MRHLLCNKNKVYDLENLSVTDHKTLTDVLSNNYKKLDPLFCQHLLDVFIIIVQLKENMLKICKPLVLDVVETNIKRSFNEKSFEIKQYNKLIITQRSIEAAYRIYVQRAIELFKTWKCLTIFELLEISNNFANFVNLNPNFEKQNYLIVKNNQDVYDYLKISFNDQKFDDLHQYYFGDKNTKFFEFVFTLFIRYVFYFI